MKRVICLCLVLLYSITLTIAQSTDSKSRSTNARSSLKKKSTLSLISKAELAWKPFWAEFSRAVKEHDHKSLREIMTSDLFCNCSDINGDGDVRDECLEDWEKPSDRNYSYIDWKDLTNLVLTGKDTYKLLQEKDLDDGTLTVRRTISPGGEVGGGIEYATFVFANGRWRMSTFSVYQIN